MIHILMMVVNKYYITVEITLKKVSLRLVGLKHFCL